MKKIMAWMENLFAPKMDKFVRKPWIAAVASSMQKILPFIFAGSVIFFYNVFRSYIPVLPDLGMIADYSFGLVGLILSFVIGQQCMEKLEHSFYITNCGLTSIALFIMFIIPMNDENGNMVIQGGRLGATGITVAIVAGILASIVFHLYSKLHVMENSNLPDFIVGWINTIIPMLIVLGIGMVLTKYCGLDVFEIVLWAFSPLQNVAQTLPGLILLCLIPAFLYTFGISTWLFTAVSTPIYMAAIQENIDAVAAGLPANNIATAEAVFTAALVTMGGIGATLALNVLMCFSKSREIKLKGRIFIGPSIFNINEPIVFGAPITFNPILMLPMWLNAIAGPCLLYTIMKLGLLNIPSTMIQVGQVPVPISTVMITQDLRGILWAVVFFVMYLAIWYPFFKIYEKHTIQNEKKQEV